MARRLAGAAGILGLVVAMIASTKFLSPGEAASRNPAEFNAKTYVNENFPKIIATLTEKATELALLAPAIEKDPVAAGKQYGTDIGSGRFAYAVKVSGTITEIDADFMVLKIPDLDQYAVRIPLGAAVNGTPVRDAPGTITFSDFLGQTEFQSVANELKLKMAAEVISKVDPPSLKGKKITVIGAFTPGGPPKSFLIQPVSIKVAS